METDLLRARKQQLQALVDVARGKEPADLVVTNARLVNVCTGEVLAGYGVACKGERIACVGPDVAYCIGPGTTVIDAGGRVLAPGLVEGHTHLMRYGVAEFVRYAAPRGTTAAIIETTEIGSILGFEGMRAMVEAFAAQPIKLFATLSPLMALAPFMEEQVPTLDQYQQLLRLENVVGLGEMYWPNLLRGDERLMTLAAATHLANKVVEGHSSGAKGTYLAAYAAIGVSSCHEPINAQEGLERLRLGMHFMARDGAIRQDMGAIAPLWDEPVDLRRMVLATDSVGPERLLRDGYLDQTVQKAIDLGLDPVKAIQMATINVAEHFRLDDRLGCIAPGRFADMFIQPDLHTIRPDCVISNGRIIAQDGRMVVEPREPQFPPSFFVSVRRPRPLVADDFRIPRLENGKLRVRAMRLVTHLVTREELLEVEVSGGEVRAKPEDDLLKVASLDRARGTDERFIGLVRGYGLKRGALATTMPWDSQSMIVVGADESDMAAAANRLLEVQGGAVVVAEGKVLAEFRAPLAGILSLEPLPEVVRGTEQVSVAARELGCVSPEPVLTADVLTTAAIPHLRITDRGYVRVKDGELVGLSA